MPGSFEQSRFYFLDGQCPELSYYGRMAEECMVSDPNICLLSLGRIAEIITAALCSRRNIRMSGTSSPPKKCSVPEKAKALAEKGIITEEISRKILALTETGNAAANEGYDSETACARLMLTAEELCRWFVLTQSEGRFAFLADLFPPDKPVPVLMTFDGDEIEVKPLNVKKPLCWVFADLCASKDTIKILSDLNTSYPFASTEAEENLHSNTRYCLICLGDIGEAAADRLICGNGIETHEKDQIARIDVLAEKYIISDGTRNTLHELRIARNKALHERYNDEYTSDAECGRLFEKALVLCEWLFRLIMKTGYIVKARITGESEGGYSALIGRMPADVTSGESAGKKSFIAGKKYVFRIDDAESEPIKLSFFTAGSGYDSQPGKLYSKYRPGQDVHATIKSLSNSTGAIVELKDGLEARIPPSELGRRIYRYDYEAHEKLVKYDTVARVKWFSLTQYPPLLLSVRDVEEGRKEFAGADETKPEKKAAMSDMDFRLFCKSAPYEKVIRALDEGANPNASNGNSTTVLMMAAQYNKNPRVVKALIDAGAELDTQNHKGNTALMYAAMSNTPEIVSMIYEAGADIDIANSQGKRAADFAVSNRKLNGTDILGLLRGGKGTLQETSASGDELLQASTLTPEAPQASPSAQEIPQASMSAQEAPQASPSAPEAPQDSTTAPGIPQASTLAQEAPQASLTAPGIPQASTSAQETQQASPSAPEAPQALLTAQEIPQASTSAQETQHESKLLQETSEPYDDSEEDLSYYEYGIHDPNEGDETPEDIEASRIMKEKLQRDFLKICRSGSEDEIAEAVSAGVSVNVTNKTSATALMFAAKSNTAQAVEILIHAGASLDAQDDSGNTALIYAAAYNTDDVADTLIDAGADTRIRNLAGHKALDYARKNCRFIDTETIRKL